MARGLVLFENSSDEEDAGDSSQWGIMARPNINSGSLIGRTTVHQSQYPALIIKEFLLVNFRRAYNCNRYQEPSSEK